MRGVDTGRAALALAALLATASAARADSCTYGSETSGTRVTIIPHDEAFAEIVIHNKLAARLHTHCRVTLFGVTVSVDYDAGSGSLPDWFFTNAPSGFRADPPQLLLDDGDTGSVLIWHEGGSTS